MLESNYVHLYWFVRMLENLSLCNKALQNMFTREIMKVFILYVFRTESLQRWRSENRSAVWLQMPIEYGRFIEVAAGVGFQFHNAEYGQCLLKLWLLDVTDGTPRFASHQLGVCGMSSFCLLFMLTFLTIWKIKLSQHEMSFTAEVLVSHCLLLHWHYKNSMFCIIVQMCKCTCMKQYPMQWL